MSVVEDHRWVFLILQLPIVMRAVRFAFQNKKLKKWFKQIKIPLVLIDELIDFFNHLPFTDREKMNDNCNFLRHYKC
jgi:hypothetical protein